MAITSTPVSSKSLLAAFKEGAAQVPLKDLPKGLMALANMAGELNTIGAKAAGKAFDKEEYATALAIRVVFACEVGFTGVVMAVVPPAELVLSTVAGVMNVLKEMKAHRRTEG